MRRCIRALNAIPFFVVLFACFLCLSIFPTVKLAWAVSHLWPSSAVYFDEPSFETETFKMSEEEFQKRRDALTNDVEKAYLALVSILPDSEKNRLSNAQDKWRLFLSEYAASLEKQQLNSQVKVFYGIEGKERKTNIYKDSVLRILQQRVMDLQRWKAGNFEPVATPDLQSAEKSLSDLKEELKKHVEYDIYVMDERYRLIHDGAMKKWKDFIAAQTDFIRNSVSENKVKVLSEELLAYRRQDDLSLLQHEGTIFYRREREE